MHDEVIHLPDKYHREYVVRFEYTRWCGRKGQRLLLDAYVPLFGMTYQLNHLFVYMFGNNSQLLPNIIEVTMEFLRLNSTIVQLVPDKNKRKNLQNILDAREREKKEAMSQNGEL